MVYSFYPFIQLSSHEEQLQGFLIFIYCDRLYFPKLATFHMLFQNLVTSPEPCKLILSQEPPNVTSSEMKDKYLLIHYFLVCIYACMCAKSLQSCLTLCDSTDYSWPGSSVHGIFQSRILEWMAMPSSRGSSQPRDPIHISQHLLHWQIGSTTSATWEPYVYIIQCNFYLYNNKYNLL